jgi:hypothetical protein
MVLATTCTAIPARKIYRRNEKTRHRFVFCYYNTYYYFHSYYFLRRKTKPYILFVPTHSARIAG